MFVLFHLIPKFYSFKRRQNPQWSKKTNPELMTLASPLWDALSPAEKENYTRTARQMRGLNAGSSSGGAGAGPRDCHGRSLQWIQERDREEKLRMEKKMTDVDDLVVQEKNGNLEDKPFFVMHANIFAKVKSFYFPGGGFVQD